MSFQTSTRSSAERAAPGTIIGGRYALRAAIGTGGMGTVWRASDTLLHREVAVKEVVCPAGLAPSDRDAMYERTLREARAAAALSHPSVVQVYDVVTEVGRPWIVMEMLDARSLADAVIEDGPLAPRAVAKIGIALLGALEVAHATGVLHRDVKPANVLICADGRCVLTDFGVARMPTDVQLTTPGMVLGSPHFISPERAMGNEFGPPSDLFSLGVSLYTAVEGRPPFDRGDPIETMHAVVEDPPAPCVRAGPLIGVLMGLLEKDPARRWDIPTARAVLRDLLAGPLTSRAHDHVTDPYAVVPAQRVAPPPAVVRSGQIGGRAMLAPGESLDAAIARLRTDRAPAADRGGEATGEWTAPTGQIPAPAHLDAPTGQLPTQPGYLASAPIGQPQRAGRPRPLPAPPARPGARRSGPTRGAAGRPGLLAAVRARPRRLQFAVAGAVAAVLLIAAVGLGNGWFDQQPSVAGGPRPRASSAPSPADRPLIPNVEAVRHGAISVNVPAGWKRSGANAYMDFVENADGLRKVRLLIGASATARNYLEIAETNLRKPSVCPSPYDRVDLRETTLAGQTAAELEYTCGEGDQARHGIWRAIVVDGTAYSFYLTVPDTRFTDSKVIFDELVRSFQLTA